MPACLERLEAIHHRHVLVRLACDAAPDAAEVPTALARHLGERVFVVRAPPSTDAEVREWTSALADHQRRLIDDEGAEE